MNTHRRFGSLKVFIGSSAEQRSLAENLVSFVLDNFRDSIDPVPWYDVFPGGEFVLESLLRVAHETDAAMLVLAADDLVTSRGETVYAPRDNLIFEAGLFIALHGHRYVRLFVPRDPGTGGVKKPTDIDGLTVEPYLWRDGDRFNASGLPTATRAVCEQLVELGILTHEAPRAAIETPRNESRVARTEPLRGHSRGLPSNSELWAVVSAMSRERYHPQGAPLEVTPEGNFEGKVYIGLPESTGTYRLQLMLVDARDGRRFSGYVATANETQVYDGLPGVPRSAMILDQISVTRA